MAAKKLYKSNTIINWDFIVMKHNEHQVEDAKKMAKDFGVNININSARANLKQNYLNPVEKLIDIYGQWLPDNPE